MPGRFPTIARTGRGNRGVVESRLMVVMGLMIESNSCIKSGKNMHDFLVIPRRNSAFVFRSLPTIASPSPFSSSLLNLFAFVLLMHPHCHSRRQPFARASCPLSTFSPIKHAPRFSTRKKKNKKKRLNYVQTLHRDVFLILIGIN